MEVTCSFADKAIFIEGDTERILLCYDEKDRPRMRVEGNEEFLMAQNISIIEVGAYSHIFEKF